MINIEGLTFQSSTQRDFVIMAIRTPQREECTSPAGNPLDKEWVTEHARQVGKQQGHCASIHCGFDYLTM